MNFVLCVCEKEKEDAHQPHNRSMQRRRAIPLLLVAWLGVGRSAPARLLLELTPIPAGTDASEGSFIDWNGHRYMARPLDRIANAAAAFPPLLPLLQSTAKRSMFARLTRTFTTAWPSSSVSSPLPA